MKSYKIWSGGASEASGPDLSSVMTKDDNEIDRNLVRYEINGLIAYHLELAKSGIIPKEDSRKIIKALLSLLNSDLHMGDGYEDVHSFIQEKVSGITLSGENLRVFLSRNDQSHFDIRSFYIDSLLKITLSLVEISESVHSEFSGIKGYMPGYTHYRQAMPLAIETYFDYISSSFMEMAEGIYSLFEKFRKYCPLGYGSGYGSAVIVDNDSLSSKLGFDGFYINPVFGASHRGLDEVEISSVEAEIFASVSRIAQDFIIYSSDEYGFLNLPDGFTTGSSLMPNKRNPDFLEMLEGYASEALSVLNLSMTIVMNKTTGYHREFQISKDRVILQTERLIEILKYLRELLSRTEIDVSKAMLATGNYSHATVNAFELFKGGVPWKESYSIIGKRVRDGDKLITYEPEVYLSYSEGNARKLAEKARKEIESRRKLNERLVREAEEFCAEV